jgi:hypothetical protein
MAPMGGSDSHTLANVARAFTTVAGARDKEEFLNGVRRGLTVPCGRSGTYARLTGEVVRIFAAGYRDAVTSAVQAFEDTLRMLKLLAVAPVTSHPLFTAAIYAHELRFGTRWFGRLAANGSAAPTASRRASRAGPFSVRWLEP